MHDAIIPFMAAFKSQRAAKEYLIGKLVAEAEREGKPLSEIERKMLYFSETDWTLPGIMEVNAEFERDYDNDEYERKICGLAKAIEAKWKNDSVEERDMWRAAIEKLCEGDHYLLVLLDPRLASSNTAETSFGDLLKPWLPGIAVVLGALILILVYLQFSNAH